MATNKILRSYRRFKPHLVMVLAQMAYTLLYFVTEASFKHGMNPHVYVTYRYVIGGLVMFPFAYFLERKVRPKLTLALLAEIFMLSLFGVGLTINMYFASMRYTSPAFIASMINIVSPLTFSIAVVLRLEVVDIRNPRGLSKVAGTLISLVGVMMMTLYKGSIIRNIWHPLLQIKGHRTIHEDWLKGSVLTGVSCLTWSIYFIMQAFILKRYPAQLSLTTWVCFIGAVQSAIYTLCVQHKSAAWAIGFNIDLWAIIYAGVVCSGLLVFVQLWCTKEKGPVFVTMFNPLLTILVAIVAYFVVSEKLYLGSIIGAIVVILGMYLFLWGKEGDKAQENPSESNSSNEKSRDFKPETSIALEENKV